MNSISDFLDIQLSRMTMYRLVVYSLFAIALLALLFMVTGYLPYSPIAFLISVAILVGVSYGSNRLFGWLFGVRPHSESALITGFILALLFIPPVTPIAATKLALVAVIAMASKYVITFRGRHIFNPAAIAIVIASLAGIGYAGWWIATPVLLPFTAALAFLILFKTRRLQMAGVFLAVAISMILLQTALSTGLTIGTALLTITSWPLVFFAGIMLCEPLTLPPRRHQQFIVAAIVGLLLGTALHIGPLTMTPAVALLVGNLLGWYWSTRGAVKLRFLNKKQMGQTMYDFTFDSSKPTFVPGQYIELTLPHAGADARGMRRVFSIVGQPGDEQVSIGTKLPEKPSSFKRALMALKTGQTVYASRVAGDFVLPDDESIPVVCIAGGIGITPFISYIMQSGKRKITIIYAVSSAADLAYVDILRHHDVEVIVVSPDDGKLPDSDWQHVKAPFVSREILKKYIDIQAAPYVFISGPPAMVNKVKHIVKALGLRYKTDHFAGY